MSTPTMLSKGVSATAVNRPAKEPMVKQTEPICARRAVVAVRGRGRSGGARRRGAGGAAGRARRRRTRNVKPIHQPDCPNSQHQNLRTLDILMTTGLFVQGSYAYTLWNSRGPAPPLMGVLSLGHGRARDAAAALVSPPAASGREGPARGPGRSCAPPSKRADESIDDVGEYPEAFCALSSCRCPSSIALSVVGAAVLADAPLASRLLSKTSPNIPVSPPASRHDDADEVYPASAPPAVPTPTLALPSSTRPPTSRRLSAAHSLTHAVAYALTRTQRGVEAR